MDIQRLQYLITQHDNGIITATEKTELYTWLSDYQNREEALHFFETTIQSTALDNTISTRNWQTIIDNILAADRQAAPVPAMVRRLSLVSRLRIKRIAIAASIIATIGIAAYFIINPERQSKGPAVVGGPTNNADIPAPDRNRAQIKLSDGTIVYLDSAANGQLANMNGVVVTKSADGKIIYSGSGSSPEGEAGVRFNTLSNPRGSKVIDITLSDGSRVWLNAGSSITYPVAFTGNQRKVTMTGEAYFEVAKVFSPSPKGEGSGMRLPFIVTKGNMSVEVLGTHFNVNAYDDETEIKVTLLEGSVNVSRTSVDRGPSSVVRLKPGQQAILSLSKETQNLELRTQNSPDPNAILAWKNGLFEFNNTGLPAIMRQIARWYDLDIIYQSPPSNEKFGGGISNSLPLSNVLKLLEANGVQFELQGKKLIVKP